MNPMVLSTNDKDTLRRLAARWAAVAALPIHREKAALWQQLNDRRPGGRPMVWINEIPWHEMDGKADVLARIPNLRKVSVSPWCKTERAVAQLGGRYVLSRKPNPAILAEDDWHPERARRELREFLDAAGTTCHVELIMKDISTVRYQPRRLWEWSRIAMEEAERAAT